MSVGAGRLTVGESDAPAREFDTRDAEFDLQDSDRRYTEEQRARPLVPAAGLTGEPVSLRRIMIQIIAEYARHNGHADLLREAIDGKTGF